jgi:hypothetical protein
MMSPFPAAGPTAGVVCASTGAGIAPRATLANRVAANGRRLLRAFVAMFLSLRGGLLRQRLKRTILKGEPPFNFELWTHQKSLQRRC